jgi:hypothetical protein
VQSLVVGKPGSRENPPAAKNLTGCRKTRVSYEGTPSQAAEKLTNVWITVEERPFRAA